MRMLPPPEDYYWYEIDQTSYDAEFDRMHQEYDQQYNSHMAKFKTPIKFTIQEIKDKLEWHESRVKKLNELSAPQLLIEHEQNEIDKLVTLWTSNDVLKSQVDRAYRKAYETHSKKFTFNFVPNIPEHVKIEIKNRLQQNS